MGLGWRETVSAGFWIDTSRCQHRCTNAPHTSDQTRSNIPDRWRLDTRIAKQENMTHPTKSNQHTTLANRMVLKRKENEQSLAYWAEIHLTKHEESTRNMNALSVGGLSTFTQIVDRRAQARAGCGSWQHILRFQYKYRADSSKKDIYSMVLSIISHLYILNCRIESYRLCVCKLKIKVNRSKYSKRVKQKLIPIMALPIGSEKTHTHVKIYKTADRVECCS